jgi:nucleotide-binding universal stress UspA family protein
LRTLIDVRVTVGSAPEEVLRFARDVQADLIVIGRGDRTTMLSVPRLRAVLQGAACPVLIVHPAGQVAVA